VAIHVHFESECKDVVVVVVVRPRSHASPSRTSRVPRARPMGPSTRSSEHPHQYKWVFCYSPGLCAKCERTEHADLQIRDKRLTVNCGYQLIGSSSCFEILFISRDEGRFTLVNTLKLAVAVVTQPSTSNRHSVLVDSRDARTIEQFLK